MSSPTMARRRFIGTLDSFLEGGEILGRGVANSNFLAALLRADPFDGYHFFLPGTEHVRTLQCEFARSFPGLMETKIRLATRLELPQALMSQEYHAFHLSDCITAPAYLARLRNLLAPDIFPITSTTHTLSYARYGQAFLAHLWPGCTKRDAVLATSRAGRDAVLAQYQWLREAYGLDIQSYPQPQVEILPLGVDADAYHPASIEERKALRNKWNLDRTALLVLGRVSHNSKMDLLPFFRAMQRLLNNGFRPGDFTIIVAGAVSSQDDYPKQLSAYAQNLGLDFRLLANVEDQDKIQLLQASDMLVSPSDNVQETFGLTIIEAQAAGLPVVASDWNGYRDLVEHGTTGYLVPTTGPRETSLADSLGHLWYDNQHHLLLAQSVAVDVAGLARAIARLARDPDLRRSMGSAGRVRAQSLFHWPRIIGRLVRLWDEFWARPVSTRAREAAHPLQPPAARIFAGHPTQALPDNLHLRWSRLGQAFYRDQDAYSVYAGIETLLRPEAVRAMVFLARKDITAAELSRRLSEAHGLTPSVAAFHILWGLKQDLLEPAGDCE